MSLTICSSYTAYPFGAFGEQRPFMLGTRSLYKKSDCTSSLSILFPCGPGFTTTHLNFPHRLVELDAGAICITSAAQSTFSSSKGTLSSCIPLTNYRPDPGTRTPQPPPRMVRLLPRSSGFGDARTPQRRRFEMGRGGEMRCESQMGPGCELGHSCFALACLVISVRHQPTILMRTLRFVACLGGWYAPHETPREAEQLARKTDRAHA